MKRKPETLPPFDKAAITRINGMAGIDPFTVKGEELPQEGYLASVIVRRNTALRIIFTRYAGIKVGQTTTSPNGDKMSHATFARAAILVSNFKIEPDGSISSKLKPEDELGNLQTSLHVPLLEKTNTPFVRRERFARTAEQILDLCDVIQPLRDGVVVPQPWVGTHVAASLDTVHNAFEPPRS